VGSVLDLLKHLPEAAKSPLAFVAYCLVIAAWVLQQWFATKPQRDAKAILLSIRDDRAKVDAITEIFNEPPPQGLTGNQAILEWVKTRSAEKTRVLMVVAWLATLVAVLVFLVAVKNASASARQISIRLYRTAGTHSSCPLPLRARVGVFVGSERLDEVDLLDCNAKLPVARPRSGRATLTLIDSGRYKLLDPTHQYELAAEEWDVSIQGPLQITLFNYSGQCPDLSQAFDTFETLIRSKANSLRRMFSAEDKRFDYLSGLSVVRTGDEFTLNSDAAHDYWQQTGSLQLLAGLCVPTSAGEVMRSQIFFGDLKGKLPAEPFMAELAVSPDEFSDTRDIHTVSILYALAQEARKRELGQDVVIEYLAEAHTIASQMNLNSGKQLLEAIDESLAEVKAPKPMELPR
jgi:hypothetical protein